MIVKISKKRYLRIIALIILTAAAIIAYLIVTHDNPDSDKITEQPRESQIHISSHLVTGEPSPYTTYPIDPIPSLPIEETDQATKDEIEEEEPEPEYVVEISQDDETMLLKLSWAEAGNQDVEGKALVMLVVLNRVKSDKFPDNIYDVIHAKNQFSVMRNGMYDKAPEDDPGCLETLELIKTGYDTSQGALYFESLKSYDSWHYKNLNFLFEHGDHWFYN